MKGGLVLQLRMGDRARTTKDVDVLLTVPRDEVHLALQAVARYQEELGAALRATFASQGDGDPPTSLPAPPASWALPFRRLAEEVALRSATLPAAHQAAQRLLEPVLGGVARGWWSPQEQSWR